MSTPAPSNGEHLGEKPSPRPHADLSGAFGPPNRSGGLAGRLTRPVRPAPELRPAPTPAAAEETEGREALPTAEPATEAAPVELPEQTTPPVNDTAPAIAPGAPANTAQEVTAPSRPARTPATKPGPRAKPTPASAAAGESQGALVTSIVYVPGDVLERLRRTRAASGLTYTHLVLDALDGTHTMLADLIAKATEPAARPAGSLFTGPSSAPASVNPKVQITLRPRSSDAAVIDRLAADLGTNRSQLVTLALDAHLPRT